MPRKPRLDAPGLLYHIMARGIEGRALFTDAKDRESFLERLGEVITETATPIYAFALMPNHFHLLLRRGKTPIATVMRRLLTGYAVYFNKRHKRCGHLFQNRYKAIICEDGSYFLELVRYINLNPVRARFVKSIEELGLYPYSGHGFLIGKMKADWFDPVAVLSHFGKNERTAKNRYLEFMHDGLSMGRRPDLTGGGLKRSLGYPNRYPKEKQAFDDRILGDGSFVEAILAEAEKHPVEKENTCDFSFHLASVCEEYKVSSSQVLGKTRTKPAALARASLAFRLSNEMGLQASEIARLLSMTLPGALKAIRKGRELIQLDD